MNSNIINTRRALLKAGTALVIAPAFLMRTAQAANYPSGPVSMMVPYPAGGPSDVSARILSEPISKFLDTPVVVENVGGATGTIAANKVLMAKANGNIFFQGTRSEEHTSELQSLMRISYAVFCLK